MPSGYTARSPRTPYVRWKLLGYLRQSNRVGTHGGGRRKVLLLLSILVIPFLLTVDASAQTPSQKAVISYSSGGITSIDLFIAREKGFFHEEGLDPQLVQMRASIAITAGIAGDVDALGSIGSAIRGIQRGAPLRVVAVTLRRPLFWLIARP